MGGVFRDSGWEDREVNVKRDELLKALKLNRAKHLVDYETACAGYRESVVEALTAKIDIAIKQCARIKEGLIEPITDLRIDLHPPAHQVKAYDQIIRMMEMSVDDTIALTSGQFACFVMDDWDWKKDWSQRNSGYLLKMSGVQNKW